jgi:hypothetical protein
MTIVRHTFIDNNLNPAAPLTSALKVDGKDFTLKVIRRDFVAADIGVNAGQTQHADGCLVAQIQGAHIDSVVHFSIFRTDGTQWHNIMDGKISPDRTPANIQKIGWKISNDKLSLYARDGGNNVAVQLVANDYIYVFMLVSNT